jgi:hypothetical protein
VSVAAGDTAACWWRAHGYALWYLAALIADPATVEGRQPPELAQLYRAWEHALRALARRQSAAVAKRMGYRD